MNSQKSYEYVEEYGGKLHAYEFKWNPRDKARITKTFLNAYPGSTALIVSPENMQEFLG